MSQEIEEMRQEVVQEAQVEDMPIGTEASKDAPCYAGALGMHQKMLGCTVYQSISCFSL